MRRKVLVIKGETAIQSILGLLRDGLRPQGEAAPAGKGFLARVEPCRFDSILLDLRSLFDAPQPAPEISSVQSRPIGRILYLIAEVSGPEVFKMIERRRAQSENFMQTLWRRFSTLLTPAASASKQVELAAGPEKY